jgi:glutaryl-CoA dehydrogenase
MSKPPAAPIHPLVLMQVEARLTEEQKAIQNVVRDFAAKELKPNIAGWYEDGQLPARDLAKALGGIGVLGMHLKNYGCAGTDAMSYGLACMELEAVDSGLRSLVSVQGSLAMFAIYKFGSEEQKQEWLPRMAAGEALGCFGLTEADAGSNPSEMRTNAKRDGDDWILNGSKMWITNGNIADVAIVWAHTDNGIEGFVVPTNTPGFKANLVKHKMSLRASITSELVFENVRLPASAVLPEVQTLRGPLSCLSEARFGILFGVVGAARDCLETAIDYQLNRHQFNRPLAAFQLSQQKIADMAIATGNGMLLAAHLGKLKDQHLLRPEQVSVGKKNNVRMALEVARESRSMLGGSGITLEYPIIRHMNNLESVYTYEGTNEIHTLVVGQALTGIAAYADYKA